MNNKDKHQKDKDNHSDKQQKARSNSRITQGPMSKETPSSCSTMPCG
jgi:hypothetical protein